ncbi:MerR family transcriptional regulator [Massilia sp. TS11]|uniref:MerR family transcriptional regulator n=1 Tax=Massilia sp. TS11 TaxID=2908003 RepID=UPI001EDC83FD|nr:MerR family transcriptional regulator [Massilia sp. TS11]MCG2585340.1 MerR family transcriptional regulator [Massilia sp. TS11]
MSDADQSSAVFTISDVARETGIAKETLRVWERRYGFPRPERDAHGERVYPADQLQRLRQLRRLLDLGHRPGKLLGMSPAELEALAEPAAAAVCPQDPPEIQHCLRLVREHQTDELRHYLTQAALQRGLRDFVTSLAGPLTQLMGEAWASGQLAVFEEHLFSEVLQVVLRNAIYAMGHRGQRPRILLTTVPQERHALGLLMAEALFALEGAQCISLGVATPLSEIASAAQAQQADVVALSFSASVPQRATLEALGQLRERLPAHIGLWAGGAGTRLARRQLPAGVRILDLGEVAGTLQEWRANADWQGQGL